MGITDKLKFGRVRAQDIDTDNNAHAMPISHEVLLRQACNDNEAILADIHSQHPDVFDGLVKEIRAAKKSGADVEVIELPREWQVPGMTGYVLHDRNCTMPECPVKDGKLDLSELRDAMRAAEPEPVMHADRAPSRIWSNALRSLTSKRIAPKIASTLEVAVEWITNTEEITKAELEEIVEVLAKFPVVLTAQLDRLEREKATTASQTAGERTEAPEAPSLSDQAEAYARERWCAEHAAEFPQPVKPIKVKSAMTGETHPELSPGMQVPSIEEAQIDNEMRDQAEGRSAFDEAAEKEAKEAAIPTTEDLPVSMADAGELPDGCTQKDADHVKGYVTCPACLQATWTEVCTEVATININGMGLDSFRKLVTLTNKMLYTAQSRAELQGHVLLPADLDLPF